MFERRREKKAAEKYQAALAQWQHERDGQAAALALAQTYRGEPTTELMLHRGEALVAKITNVGLIEERKGPGRWQGGSSGVSIPVGSLGGHAIRYHVGATRGHYVQGTPHPTAIDTGTVFITNQRLVFTGHAQTRECAFTKLLGYQHGADGSTTLSVSNRQKPVTIFHGAAVSGWVQLRLELALAQFRGEVPALVQRIQEGLTRLDADKPQPPPPPA